MNDVFRARRLSSKLLTQGYLAERLNACHSERLSFRKFYGRYGDRIQQYEVSLSRMLNDILILDQQWLSNQSDFQKNFMTILYTELDLHRSWVVSMEHLQRVRHARRERLPFRTPGSVPHCLCSNCWDQIPRTCHVFNQIFTSNIPWYDFALFENRHW